MLEIIETMEAIATHITEITGKLNDLQAFFIMLLIVILAAIGIFGYVVMKMILDTKERTETRNKQIENAMQTAMCAINIVEEQKMIFENYIKHNHEEIKDLRQVDVRIFDEIKEFKNMFIRHLQDLRKK